MSIWAALPQVVSYDAKPQAYRITVCEVLYVYVLARLFQETKSPLYVPGGCTDHTSCHYPAIGRLVPEEEEKNILGLFWTTTILLHILFLCYKDGSSFCTRDSSVTGEDGTLLL
jgi:hypothetical protein